MDPRLRLPDRNLDISHPLDRLYGWLLMQIAFRADTARQIAR